MKKRQWKQLLAVVIAFALLPAGNLAAQTTELEDREVYAEMEPEETAEQLEPEDAAVSGDIDETKSHEILAVMSRMSSELSNSTTINLSDSGEVLQFAADNSGGRYSYDGSSHITIYGTNITITGTTKIRTVTVSGNCDITLNQVDIDVSGNNQAPALSVDAGANVTLTLMGNNTLKSGYGQAGLAVPHGAGLHIKGADMEQSLDVTGGTLGSGIGGYKTSVDGGNITISGGKVTAQGGMAAAGIGGGYNGSTSFGSGGTVRIRGGVVIAKSSSGGAGIGGAVGGDGGDIGISGGVVIATGISGGAGIGGGGAYNQSDISGGGGGIINISGGHVTAIGGNGAGIGGGNGSDSLANGSGGNITISGGTVIASATAGRAIGLGRSGTEEGTSVTITGGSIQTTSNVQPQIYPDPTDGINIVYLNTLTLDNPAVADGVPVTAVTVDGDSRSYDYKNMETADGGLLYLYLPENTGGEALVSVSAGGTIYMGRYERPPIALTETLTGVMTRLTSDADSLDFGRTEPGYTSIPAEKKLVIKNTGAFPAYGLTVEGAGHFDITGLDAAIGVGGTCTVTVQPKAGLALGTYRDIITISGENFGDITITATFQVASKGSSTGSGSADSSDSSDDSDSPVKTVRFETNGGTMVKSQHIGPSGKAAEPKIPVKEGYEFTGWYVDRVLSALYDFNKPVTDSFTLYAGWKAIDIKEEEQFPAEPENKAYISGYPDGTFRPNENLARAESAQMLYGIANRDGKDRNSLFGIFSDVEETDWYYTAIGNLAGWGIVRGRGLGTEESVSCFAPEEPITRAEFLVMAFRYGEFSDLPVEEKQFSDVEAGHWAASWIKTAVSQGIVSGYPDGTFRPDETITRAEAVTILNSILDRDALAEGTGFTDVPKSHWAYGAITSASTEH